MASPRSALGEPMLHEAGNQTKMRIITCLSFFVGFAAVVTWSNNPFDVKSTASTASGLWAIGRAGIPRVASVALQPRRNIGLPGSSEMPRIITCQNGGFAGHQPGPAPNHGHDGFWGAATISSEPTMPPGLDKLGDLTEKFTVGGGQKGVICLTNYILAYRNNQRQGNACTKTRGEVRGGGRKPYKQKKTGRARLGSIRSPLKVGGGVIFGPKPKDWSQKVNRKEKKLAMARAFWEAAVTGVVEVVPEDWGVTEGKTKEGVAFFEKYKIDTGPNKRTPEQRAKIKNKIHTPVYFAVDSEWDGIPHRGLRNIGDLNLQTAARFNPYDVVRADKILITKRGLDVILDRINLGCEEEEEKELVSA